MTNNPHPAGAHQGEMEPPAAISIASSTILDIELLLSIRFGRVQLPLADVLELRDGSILNLDSRVDDPVEVIVNGKVLAYGRLSVVDGHYAVEIVGLHMGEGDLRGVREANVPSMQSIQNGGLPG